MTRVIKVLGTGCPKCQSMTKVVKEAVSVHNIDATVEKVEDIMEILKFNVMSTPALVIDNDVVLKGRVPNKTEVLDILKAHDTVKTNSSKDGCC